MATEVKWIDVLYLLTHHLSLFCHCRIYLGVFPLKYQKNDVFTPGFGPETGFIDRKLEIYVCVLLLCHRITN